MKFSHTLTITLTPEEILHLVQDIKKAKEHLQDKVQSLGRFGEELAKYIIQ